MPDMPYDYEDHINKKGDPEIAFFEQVTN